MDRINEIQEIIKNFIDEKYQIRKEISEIEEKRMQLAEERNTKKYSTNTGVDNEEINELGRKIADLGNQSQELQNKLNSKYISTKNEVNMQIDNLISEEIRQIRRAEEEQEEDESSEYIEEKIEQLQQEIIELAREKRELKNNNWSKAVETENKGIIFEETEEESIVLPFIEAEEVSIAGEIGEFEPIEKIEETEPMEELVVENFEPIGEVEIIPFEENNVEEENDKIEIQDENVRLLNIIAKVEDGEIIYKAQLSNGKTIEICATRTENIVQKDKESRNQIKEMLINYATSEYKMLEKRVIKKIDTIVCDILVKFAEEYGYNKQNLIYNYAMSFSRYGHIETEMLPQLVYNFSFINETKLTRKEKEVFEKACRNAAKNEQVEIIGYISRISQFKYMIKRIFNLNKTMELPEGKYE